MGLGGLLGSVARFWLAGITQRLIGGEFPVGTLAVNLLGSFIVGIVIALLLTAGFCGGFTTMSAFSYETVALLRDEQTAFALGNIAASVGGSLAATWLGYSLGRIA
ncbi:MAG: fluoride efflux transporter FluC [Candidatus Rokuibacteriota bacterium]